LAIAALKDVPHGYVVGVEALYLLGIAAKAESVVIDVCKNLPHGISGVAIVLSQLKRLHARCTSKNKNLGIFVGDSFKAPYVAASRFFCPAIVIHGTIYSSQILM
jgi:hypothetical protein